METFFELEVQGNIVGKTLGSGFAGELLLVGEEIERESGAGFERVGDFQLMDDRELEQREVSPGKETVGSIPAIWAWLLPAEDRAVDIKVEGLIGAGAGPSVGAHQHVALAKVVAKPELNRLVVVVARVVEQRSRRWWRSPECRRRNRECRSGRGIRLSDRPRRGVSFPGQAPIDEARDLELAAVDCEVGFNRAGGGDAVYGADRVGDRVERVLARSGVRACNQVDGSCIVDEADSGGEFCVAGVVEDVGSGESRGDDGVANNHPNQGGCRARSERRSVRSQRSSA